MQKGFTLAEVLITLGIIGVVATMTMPTLISDYREKQTITAYKKAMSVINQSYLHAINEYGTPDTWGMNVTNTGQKDNDNNPIYDFSGPALVATRIAENLKGAVFLKQGEKFGDVCSVKGSCEEGTASTDNTFFKLPDGTAFKSGWVGTCSAEGNCGAFWIYLPAKKHVIGKNTFFVNLTPKGFIPLGDTKGDLKNSGCPDLNDGRYCSAWALYMENLDYLKCDDLNWDTKHKCK